MYKKEILDNKIRIITEEIPHVRSVALGIWIGAGVEDEGEENHGISHFIEHMMFKGTKKRTALQIANEIEAVGGQLNAVTSKEYTCYYVRILAKHIFLALNLLSDMLNNSLFSSDNIEKEKKVILEEIRSYEDSPDDLVHDLFVENVWEGHPLGRNILGKKEIINSLNRDKIKKFFSKEYRTDNLIIAVAGDLKHEDFIEKVKSIYEKKYSSNFFSLLKKNAKFNPKIKIFNKKLEQVHFCLGTEGVHQTHEDKYTLAVLDAILGGGMSSRLFQTIREKKALAYSIYSYEHSYKRSGLFGIYTGCNLANFKKVVSLIIKEFEKIKKENVKKEELNKTKEQLKGALMLSLESTLNRMSKLGRAEFYLGRELTLDEIISEIDKVKREDIDRLSNKMFDRKKIALIALGPLEEKNEKEIREVIYD